MSRLVRHAGAVLFAVVFFVGISTGPVFGTDKPSPEPTPIAQPLPTTTRPTSPPSTTPVVTTTTTAPSEPTTTTQPTTSSEQPAPVATTTTESPSATPTDDTLDLRLSAWFDKPAYFNYESITVHARVTNVGTASTYGAMVGSTGNFSSANWKPFDPGGVWLAPGQSVEGTATGMITTAEGPLTLVVTAYTSYGTPDANPADNTVTVSVPVTFVRGSYRGTVYGDRNGNNVMDPGEALSGITIRLAGGNPSVVRTAVTDADGRFVFLDLPGGTYYWDQYARYDSPFYLYQPPMNVTGTADPDVLVRGLPLVGTALSASMAFTEPAYHVNDVARINVTLTNNGTVLLTGLTVTCASSTWTPVDAGELAYDGPGVSLPPHSTRTSTMTVPVTFLAANAGYLRVGCSTGAPPTYNAGPGVEATGRVPGGVAAKVVGHLGLFVSNLPFGPPWNTPLPGVTVYLRNQVTGAVVARAVTDAGGDFTFYRIPADIYDFGVVGPWHMVWYWPEFAIRSGENGDIIHYMVVEPGPDQPDPGPVQEASGPSAPAQQPGTPTQSVEPSTATTAALAMTGANVTWLALGGLLSLVVGAMMVLHAARRRLR
jgi:hypothetical protein